VQRPGVEGARAVDLVELNEQYAMLDYQVVQGDLTVEADMDIIRKHEVLGMFGNPDQLRERLVRYFDTWVDWENSKAFLFDLARPRIGQTSGLS